MIYGAQTARLVIRPPTLDVSGDPDRPGRPRLEQATNAGGGRRPFPEDGRVVSPVPTRLLTGQIISLLFRGVSLRQIKTTTRTLGVLRERDFRKLYCARAFSLIGDGIAPVALSFGVLQVRNSATALGTVLAARSVALVIFLLFGGVIADRFPRRDVLIGSDVVRMIMQATTAAVLISHTATVTVISTLAFIYGLGDAIFRPTSTGMVPQTISPGRLQQANALIATTQSATTIVGPLLASIIIVSAGPGWAIASDAVTFLVSALFIMRLPSLKSSTRRPQRFTAELRQGWHEFRSRRWLFIDGLFSGMAGFAMLAPFLTLGPVVAKNHLGGAVSWAVIMLAFGIGSLAGGIAIMRVRPSRPLLAALPLAALLAIPSALLAIRAPTGAIAVGAFVGGFGLATFNTLLDTAVQRHVPPDVLSRVASFDWVLSASLLPLGCAVAGPISAIVGISAVFTFSAVWMIASTAAALAVPDIRSLSNQAG